MSSMTPDSYETLAIKIFLKPLDQVWNKIQPKS